MSIDERAIEQALYDMYESGMIEVHEYLEALQSIESMEEVSA